MSPTLDAFLRSWPFDPWLLVGLLLCAGLYYRGWRFLNRRDPQQWPETLPVLFLSGLTILYLALASPIEPFAALLLQVHMVQHLLLMMVVPPLLWLGCPLLPLLRGLPRPILVTWVAPLLALRPLRRLGRFLTHPLTSLPLFLSVTWLGHAPPIYNLALRSPGWHYLQHVCFLGAGLLIWYPIVRPYPCRPTWSIWLLFPTLIIADLSNTLLAALLTFSDRVIYPYYNDVPRLTGFTPLDDQATAGVIMWVPGSAAFLLPLIAIGVKLLSGSEKSHKPLPLIPPGRIPLPMVTPRPAVVSSPLDLLRVPLLGRFLRWRHARLCLQIPLLLLAGLVIYDGWRGPQVGALNLAGVLPWIHWRGLLILGLLVVGNIFCMSCPFLLPRTLARRWLPANWAWPRRLRGKWLAVLLILVFLWAYEAFALWDRPWWTACLALAYFVGAFLVDGLFRGASFCKYVCPIGQFNFVQSLMSPFEIKPRDLAVCGACRTKDCLRGRDGIPGCELRLFLPRKVGNMDCTTCLDCVHACPHDNVGLIARTPGAELWDDRPRSGVGRLFRRPDIAALVIVLVFGAFANAAGMVAPVVQVQQRFQEVASPLLATTLFYLLALLFVPTFAIASAAALSRRWGRLAIGTPAVATRFAYCLVPLGFSMWLAHYSFHFLTSYDTVVPAARRLAEDAGMTSLGAPLWVGSDYRPAPTWLLPLEILFLDMGLLLSLYTAYRLAAAQTQDLAVTVKVATPWLLLIFLLFSTGIWILFQPMEMRGVLGP